MELNIEKILCEEEYQIKVFTKTFSTSDLDLIKRFDDPLVEMGGEIFAGTAQVDNLDLTGATVGEVSVEIEREGRSLVKVSTNFDTDIPTTAQALTDDINSKNLGVIASYVGSGNLIVITSDFPGKQIDYTNATQLIVTGITPNSKVLLATISSDLKKLEEDLAQFFTSFKSDAYSNTEQVADSYVDVITGRITDSLRELRLKEDSFTESINVTI